MPLYEGLSIDDKVIVLDIGSAYTKCGLAGETGPRCIVKSEVKNARTQQMVNVWDFRNTNDLYENLKDLLYGLINRHLLITAKDRKIVVIESLFCPSDFRETLAKVLFNHFEVGWVYVAPAQLLALLTLGTSTGLVMDVGHQETSVIPVYEGIPVMKGWQAMPLAGKAIESRIKSQLLEHGTVSTPEQQYQAVASVKDSIPNEVLEDIKVRCCFVTEYSRGQQIQEVTMRGGHANKLPPPPPDTDYPLDGGSVLNISGRIREHSCEVLFEQDNDETSIATMVLESLVHCPMDTRRALSQGVLVMGGTAMLPGFLHRLQLELSHLLALPRYANQTGIKQFRFHTPPSKANYTAWLGGALIGAVETLPMKSLSRDAYLQRGKLPDWCYVDTDEAHQEKTAKS